jgi:hypothetical protein
MNPAAFSSFELFAVAFVRNYWDTVKSGDFPMPPHEPVEETIEELLSAVSHQTETSESAAHRGACVLRMMNTHGDWWVFTFRDRGPAWEIVEASSGSGDHPPHDLLGPTYAPYFEPFLRHVTSAANDAKGI